MDRKQYEKDLRRRQSEHLKRISERQDRNWKPCAHDGCSQCHGTGVKSDGTQCVHMLHCDCPKCKPYSMRVDPPLGGNPNGEILDGSWVSSGGIGILKWLDANSKITCGVR